MKKPHPDVLRERAAIYRLLRREHSLNCAWFTAPGAPLCSCGQSTLDYFARVIMDGGHMTESVQGNRFGR